MVEPEVGNGEAAAAGGDNNGYSSSMPTRVTLRKLKFPASATTTTTSSTTTSHHHNGSAAIPRSTSAAAAAADDNGVAGGAVTLFSLAEFRAFRREKAQEAELKQRKRVRKSLNSLSEAELVAMALKRSMEQ